MACFVLLMRCGNNNTNRLICYCHIIIDILAGHIASQPTDKHATHCIHFIYYTYIFKSSVNIECKAGASACVAALFFWNVIHCRAYLCVFREILLKILRASRCKDILNICTYVDAIFITRLRWNLFYVSVRLPILNSFLIVQYLCDSLYSN